jgi:hypothetical protein
VCCGHRQGRARAETGITGCGHGHDCQHQCRLCISWLALSCVHCGHRQRSAEAGTGTEEKTGVHAL